MANHKSPLRDRLLSNSPDPIKSSILRESGMGWNSQSSGSLSSSSSGGSITSPLRISKRDSPARPRGPAIARRSSSSYKHVHNNNLVSKSPFKSQIPTPSTLSNRLVPIPITFPTSSPSRRVSGEKRPRPSSLYEQAENENERPFALKRERRQSKGFQNLIEKEPVTKSPFKLRQRSSSDTRPSSSPIPEPLTRAPLAPFTPSAASIQPPASLSAHPLPAISSGPSPGRSSLVSKRMHGPRLSGGGKRERRKTVTFDERCDVVEFDREEETDEEALEMNEDGDAEDDADDPFFQATGHLEDRAHEEVMGENESYESIQLSDTGSASVNPSLMALDPDTSITGLVEEIFFSPNARNFLPDSSFASNASTPPRHSDLPTDLDTEDGVPFGRSHHVERFIQHHHQQPSQTQQPPGFSPHDSPRQLHSLQRNHAPGSYPFSFNLPTHASPQGPPATPPRRSPGMLQSTPPLGRSTHLERIKQAREEEKEEDADDVTLLPLSPSPMKRPSRDTAQGESLVPRFSVLNEIQAESSCKSNPDGGADPFQHSSLQEESPPEIHVSSRCDDSVGSVNASIGNSEVSFVSSEMGDIGAEVEPDSLNSTEDSQRYGETADAGEDEQERSPSHPDFQSPVLADIASPIGRASSPVERISSPIGRVTSPLLTGDRSPSMEGRPRINKEEVRRRLLGRRSVGSPSPERRSPSPREEKSPECEASQVASDVKVQVDVNSERLRMEYEEDRERDRMSVLTGQTDFSTETAIVEQAERRNVLASVMGQDRVSEREFGFLSTGERLQFDFGSKFGLGGLGISDGGNAASNDNLNVTPVSARARADSVSGGSGGSGGMKMGNIDVDMEMKSALDRLMEDVASGRVDDSMMTDECDGSYDQSQDSPVAGLSRPTIMERVATDSALLYDSTVAIPSRTVSNSSVTTIPPQVPPKDNIKNREQIILERRREARRIQEEEEEAFRAPSKANAPGKNQRHLGVGRPSRRRSMSTGDLLDVRDVAEDDPLADSIEKELSKLVEQPKKSKYHIREREAMIYASSSEDKISHMAGPGDVDAGKAWRAVRRPSDMNEYSKQIKEYRAKENLGKAYGKVFVKVLGVKGIHLPLPDQATTITCTLNNGIHFVTTPECQLSQDCRIDQEFELIEHSKLEFTLTIKVRRDPHIISQFKALAPAPPPPPPAPIPPPVVQTASKSSGMRSFFSSSPKKAKEKVVQPPPTPPPPTSQPLQRLPENLARYLKPDGTLARSFISFKDIATRCDTRLFETSYPLIGQRVELGGKFSTLQVGEILLQMFRLPPLPGIPSDQLPQSLEDCHRGLRHINWHKVTYFQGTLTQSGGDCSTWRRRQLRVVGANLVAFNDVTKKATATIDLKKAIAVEDDQEARNAALSSSAGSNPRSSRYADEYDGLYGVERSFRLIFPRDEEIIFFADTDEEKGRWLEVLRALVGRIPPHPLWAELLWQRHEEITKRNQVAQQTIPPSSYALTQR